VGQVASPGGARSGFLSGVRVLEVADELGEYCGKVLAGLGADVVKVEPRGGEVTRGYGPFLNDEPGLERSLCFWHYNFGKRSVVVDLDSVDGQERFRELASDADVVLETRPAGYLAERGLAYDDLCRLSDRLVVARISPFGDDGPWGDYKASDLVHLALGGVMMNCGYDPDPSGVYETPPIAPQMWQAYHIAGEMTAIAIMGALYHREEAGVGQYLHTAVHDAVAKNTETDLPNWVYCRLPHFRSTCRHSRPDPEAMSIALTKDGRWLLPYRTYLHAADGTFERTVALLDRHGSADDLLDERYLDVQTRAEPTVAQHINDVIGRFVGRFLFNREIWREFQDAGLTWAPLRRPEENVDDAHWRSRETFLDVEHPELGRSFTEVGAKWLCAEVPWPRGPRAPLLGEHENEVFGAVDRRPVTVPDRVAVVRGGRNGRRLSRRGKPFALEGVRVIELSWLLASAGAGRFLAALGAEVIKVEHKSRPDLMRWGPGAAPPGGREERERAERPLRHPTPQSPNRSGFYLEINSGKRCISLNLKDPRGKELLTRLIQGANAIAEGFSPGTMDRMGFGYDRLKEINPSIVYAQQSGMGQVGTYGRMRSYGPVAAGFSGLSEMSGLPEPYPPAGIGYSYLDWFGAYNLATAMIAGIYRQKVTGRGCWVDSSQVETGTYLNGTAILDYSVNGRRWTRYGNRSPYRPAAPSGAYRVAGEDRWIAISCFTDDEWRALASVLGLDPFVDPRFATLDARLAHQDELDATIGECTRDRDGYALMDQLQAEGIPAGVCQTAQDRYERDPQLRHLEWLVELEQTEIGTWPVKELPVRLDKTPAYIGGIVDRHGPNYGEDNDYVYRKLLGLSHGEIDSLAEDGVI
jgi:crotonobetainyl-CoA:carnitine CoA-transferase CaiB-like acyl-CoA transferase